MSKPKYSVLPKQILDYVKDQNRPFSANDIFNNMRIDCGKTAMTRALDLLVSEEKIKEKTYGKQKIYYVNQSIFSDADNESLPCLDAQINNLSNTLNILQKEIKNSENILGDLNKGPTTETAEAELKAVKDEISMLENKLKNIESKSGHIDPNEKKALCEKKEKCMKAYHRRKRIANNIIDAILEGYPKPKKQLLEELGVETDGDLKL